jgi:lipopolysaccharide export system protein LptA
MAVALVWAGVSDAAAAEKAPEKKAPAKKGASKGTLKLRAKSILFNRSKGDLVLVGDVHVVRKVGDQTLTVDCDKMTSKMKDGKMQSVLATGNVKLLTADVRASSATADFDFKKNIITLRGADGKPATMTTLKDPVIISTGPTIIFHVDDQRVAMPDGGDTEIPLDTQLDETEDR